APEAGGARCRRRRPAPRATLRDGPAAARARGRCRRPARTPPRARAPPATAAPERPGAAPALPRRADSPRPALLLLPPVLADQRPLADRVRVDHEPDQRRARSIRDVELVDLQRVDREHVAMRLVARRRARTAPARGPEVG